MAKSKPQTQTKTENVFDDGVEFDPKKIKKVKDLTSSFKWEEGKTYYFKVTGAMYVREEEVGKKKGKGKNMGAATMLPVYDLEKKRAWELIAGTIVKDRLVETYPNDSYVGKCFSFIKYAPADGNRYAKYDIEEFEMEG